MDLRAHHNEPQSEQHRKNMYTYLLFANGIAMEKDKVWRSKVRSKTTTGKKMKTRKEHAEIH